MERPRRQTATKQEPTVESSTQSSTQTDKQELTFKTLDANWRHGTRTECGILDSQSSTQIDKTITDVQNIRQTATQNTGRQTATRNKIRLRNRRLKPATQTDKSKNRRRLKTLDANRRHKTRTDFGDLFATHARKHNTRVGLKTSKSIAGNTQIAKLGPEPIGYFDLEACPTRWKHISTWRERFIYQILITGPRLHLQENLNTTAVTFYFLNKTALPKHDGGDFLFSK